MARAEDNFAWLMGGLGLAVDDVDSLSKRNSTLADVRLAAGPPSPVVGDEIQEQMTQKVLAVVGDKIQEQVTQKVLVTALVNGSVLKAVAFGAVMLARSAKPTTTRVRSSFSELTSVA